MKKITVIGGGAWGTAVSQLMASTDPLSLWCFEQEVADSINTKHVNEIYLPGVSLDKKIQATSNLKEALEGAEIIFCAIPVPFMRTVLEQAKPYVKPEHKWVLLSKGIEQETKMFPSDILCDVMGNKTKYAILSGPNLAKEVAQKKSTATMVASHDDALADEIKEICERDFFRIEISSDVMGVQIGGAIKNVMAIFLGIACGARVNENLFAFFFSRAIDEMVKISEKFGGHAKTIYGLAGVGDLMLSLCEGGTRNYVLGKKLGEGQSIGSEKILPEGVNTVEAFCRWDYPTHEFPICAGVHKIFHNEISIPSFLQSLFNEESDR
jgi:glycerol-3-phosphate dehydrogenase (NAD(P)+)